MEGVGQWIGVPFKLRGRSPDTGWDCLGLVEYCQPRLTGAKPLCLLDLYGAPDRSTTGMMADAFDQARSVYRKLDGPAPGALVLFRTGRVPFHVGLYLRDGAFLHVRRQSATLISNLGDPDYERIGAGFYMPA